MSSKIYDIDELNEMKKQILLKKKQTPKEDTEQLKEILNEYMRIQKKIKYYSDEEHRKNKINSVSIYNKSHQENYNLYQKNYYRAKKLISSPLYMVSV